MIKHFRIAGLLRTKLEETGVSVPAVLRRASLPQDLFSQTRVLVTTEQLFALWHAIAHVSADPAIGLKLATEDRIARFHPSGIAALSTENFGDAVEHLGRYKRLSVPEEILQDRDGPNGDQEWRIQFRWTLAIESEPQALIDYCFAAMLNIGRVGTGTQLCALRVELVQPRTNLKQMQRHFGCPVVTGAAHNAIVFRATDAAIPFVTRNAELLEMLAPQFELDLKQHTTGEDTFLELVRGAIQQRLTGHRPTTDDVARELHMSPRTLQRRLQDAGSSFQRVLDEARHQMARYYLRHSVLELNEAAYLLGYEDASSFARAFRTWEGVPPGQFREANRAETIN